MTANIIALGLTAVISIILPLFVFVFFFVKNKIERKNIFLIFVLGIGVYFLMDWGVKEHLLTYLFNNTNLNTFTSQNYIMYLFLVAVVGAFLTLIPEYCLVRFMKKERFTFHTAIIFGLGYAMTEATMLVGYRSILTIVHLMKDDKLEINVSSLELFLSGYERLLIIIIQIGIIASFIYFMEHNMRIRACIIKVFCHTLVMFLPGLFLAFTTKNYYEVYDRSIALILIYVIFTASAFTSLVVLNSIKYSFFDTKK